jgi:AraC-like DNA-binding protein
MTKRPEAADMALEAASESIYFARAVFAGVVAYGHDPGAMAARFGVTPEMLADPDARLPAPLAVRIWDEVPRIVGDELFGYHLAERVPIGALPVVGYLVQSSATLRQGMERSLRYQRLLQNLNRTEAEITPERMRIFLRVRGVDPDLLRNAMDFAFGFVITLSRTVTGKHITPRRVRLLRSPPPNKEEYARLFGDNVEFGSRVLEMELDPEVVDLPVATADPHLGEILERHADAQLARVPEGPHVTGRARAVILQSLRGGAPALDDVARCLHMGGRTLQRRLRDEGTSLADLLDDVRRDLAMRYIDDASLALAEIALLLGFSDQTTFHRAFVRWSGQSPGAFRRAKKSAADQRQR